MSRISLQVNFISQKNIDVLLSLRLSKLDTDAGTAIAVRWLSQELGAISW